MPHHPNGQQQQNNTQATNNTDRAHAEFALAKNEETNKQQKNISKTQKFTCLYLITFPSFCHSDHSHCTTYGYYSEKFHM